MPAKGAATIRTVATDKKSGEKDPARLLIGKIRMTIIGGRIRL